MRTGILAALSIAGLAIGACRPAEPPVLEINRPALASLGGERAICNAFISAVASRNRPALRSLIDSLPRTPGVERDVDSLIELYFSIMDRLSVSTDIVDIRPIGRGAVERTSVYYYEVEFLRLNEPYLSNFSCEIEYEEGRGGSLGLGTGFAKPKSANRPPSEARVR